MIFLRKRQDNTDGDGIKERLADTVDISKEVILDTVLVSLIGNREMTVENYKGILEYSEECIKIKAKPKPVIITGRSLELKNITRELLYITGRIDSFKFE